MTAGEQIELNLGKPVAGGRMIARHEGQVVLVLGGIPGERVLARVDKVDKRLAFATTVEVTEPSPDRRPAVADPLCGGFVYSHIEYCRQLTLKGEVVADAFQRIARLPLASVVPVAGSPESGYRLRARLHVRGTAAGFYREGTHEICDAAATGQLGDETLAAAVSAVRSLTEDGAPPVSIEITENLDGSERAAHMECAFGARLSEPALSRAAAAAGLRGCTGRAPDGVLMSAGTPWVSDSFAALTDGRGARGELRRHAQSFFQANRFLLPSLVTRVLDAVPASGDVVDLYAGVGLFSLSLAATARTGLTAIEGDSSSAGDLKHNAAQFGDAVRVLVGSVEQHLPRFRGRADTIVVDPPRTGISKEAMDAIVRQNASRMIYVSCDAPTMARDARRLVDAGYEMNSIEAFDLFPNTPHVETVGTFIRK